MNKRIRILLVMAVAVFVMAGMAHAVVTITPVPSADETLASEKRDFYQGEIFWLLIKVDDATDMAGAALTLNYDPTYFEVYDAADQFTAGSDTFLTFFDTRAGANPASAVPSIGNKGLVNGAENTNKVLFSGAYIDTATGGGAHTGEEIIFKVKFKVKSDAPADSNSEQFSLSQTSLFNPTAGWFVDSNANKVYDEGVDPTTPVNVHPLVGAVKKDPITEQFPTPETVADDFPPIDYGFADSVTVTVKERTWNLDADGNGKVEKFFDGYLILRYMFGMRGTSLISNAVAADATRKTATEIETYIKEGVDTLILDIDGNGKVEKFFDGYLQLRYMFGMKGSSLIANAVAADATRKTATEIEPYIFSLYP